LRGYNNDYPFPPELLVTNQAMLRRETMLRGELNELVADTTRALDSNGQAAFENWRGSLRTALKEFPDGWSVARKSVATVAETNSISCEVSADGVVMRGMKGKADTIDLEAEPPAGWLAALRLELVAGETNGTWARKPGTETDITLEAELQRGTNSPTKLAFRESAATTHLPRYQNGTELLRVHPSWKLPGMATTNSQCAVFVLDTPVHLDDGATLKLKVTSANLASFRVATTPLAAMEPLKSGADDTLRRAVNGRATKANIGALAGAWIRGTTNRPAEFGQLKQLEADIRDCRGGMAMTQVTESSTNRLVMRVLPRGNWQDQSGEIVTPAVPHFLPQPKHDGTNLLTRLDLARWLVAPENPLTARAFVNRLWKQLVGNGLSNQPEELGAQGESPTHPELLDWLAVEFRESGWDVKHLVRLIVNSATYQQDSKFRPELRDIDPNNRLLARQNARRLDAEFVRDNALAIAGLLNPEVGGPSAFPYQPAGYYANIQFPDRDYSASPDELQYRRGLYSHWQRTFLHPMLANFDAPAREECAVDRPQSCTPQQALTLLNDPSFVEAARAFAERILTAPKTKTDVARVDFAIETALLRPAKPAERESLVKFLDGQRSYYAANTADAEKLLNVGQHESALVGTPAERAAWTSVARVILNLHESITRY